MPVRIPISLGDFTFDLFEVPEVMKFGGPERIAVHFQPNGARTIDILGRDDDPYVWSGIFLSENATERAKTLEAMKVAGGIYALKYGSYNKDVVISKLDFVYHASNWIDYVIECTPIYNADVDDPGAIQLQNIQNGVNNAAGQ